MRFNAYKWNTARRRARLFVSWSLRILTKTLGLASTASITFPQFLVIFPSTNLTFWSHASSREMFSPYCTTTHIELSTSSGTWLTTWRLRKANINNCSLYVIMHLISIKKDTVIHSIFISLIFFLSRRATIYSLIIISTGCGSTI